MDTMSTYMRKLDDIATLIDKLKYTITRANFHYSAGQEVADLLQQVDKILGELFEYLCFLESRITYLLHQAQQGTDLLQ